MKSMDDRSVSLVRASMKILDRLVMHSNSDCSFQSDSIAECNIVAYM